MIGISILGASFNNIGERYLSRSSILIISHDFNFDDFFATFQLIRIPHLLII
jgi:hypothetical protein